MASPSQQPVPKIAAYRLLKRLGAGGMGEVHLAFDERLERRVALKQILPEASSDARARRRFQREARSAARLNHPNIVKIHDFLTAEGSDWIVMEYVEGRTLAGLVDDGPLACDRALPLATEIAEALAAAHAQGIVHRDLKCRNVIVTPQNHAKILDFGLAKQILFEDGASTSLSIEGQVLGTPYAMSPEQAMGQRIDFRSDFFSLGVLLYEAVTGVSPFRGANPLATLARICTHRPPAADEIVPSVPRGLSALIDRLLAKEPSQRPRTAGEIVDALQRVAETPDVAWPLESRDATLGGEATIAGSREALPGPAASEQRQLTVMCCDLVAIDASSSALDPASLYAVLGKLEELVREAVEHPFEGHVATALGHRVWVYFGYPSAHEDDALRAVRAARRLLPRLGTLESSRQLALRIGIHTGQAVVLGDGSRQQVALGQTLDLATGLHRLAGPNRILVSGATYRLIAEEVRAEELPALRLKGFGEPVEVFRIDDLRDVSSRWQMAAGLTPLVARERELNFLVDRWQLAREGHGQVILVSGEAGIGKSRLVHALRERMAAEAPTWLAVHGSAYATSSPLSPILELLRGWFKLDPGDADEKQLAMLERGLGRHGLATEEIVALLAALLAIALDDRYPSLGLTPERRRRRTLAALVELLSRMAEEQPVLLVAEDLHWMDPSTLEFLGLLIERCAAIPLFLILTFRLEFETPWGSPAHSTQLNLTRLGTSDAATLIARVTGGKALPAEVREQILVKTDGVPLFVEELTKNVLETGHLVEKEDRYELEGPLENLAMPTTLRASLTARLDRLGTAKAVAQQAAVVGREFSHQLLAAVSPLDEASLRRELHRLVAADLLHRKGFASRRRYLFKHALIQDAAYDSLLARQRRDEHERVASVLEERFRDLVAAKPEILGHHWAMADQPGKAIPCFTRAGDRSKAAYANAEAIVFYRRAVQLLGEKPDEAGPAADESAVHLHENLGDLMTLGRRFEEARAEYRHLLRDSPQATIRARAHRKRARALELENREAEALDELETAQDLLGEPAPAGPGSDYWSEWIAVQLVKGWVLYRQCKLEEMTAMFTALQSPVERHGTHAHQADFFETKVRLLLRQERFRPSDETLASARRYLSLSREIGEKGRLADAWFTLGFVALFRDEHPEAESSLSEALQQATHVGDATLEVMCLAYLSLLHRKEGRTERTRHFSSEILNHDTRMEYRGLAEANLAWVAWRQGNSSELQTRGAAALECWRDVSMSYPLQWTAVLPLLAASLDRGELPQAVDHARVLLDPDLERLPKPLEQSLKQGVKLWKAGSFRDARRALTGSIQRARSAGRL